MNVCRARLIAAVTHGFLYGFLGWPILVFQIDSMRYDYDIYECIRQFLDFDIDVVMSSVR